MMAYIQGKLYGGNMIKELCNHMEKLIKNEFGKVLAGVLSCCMLLNGCGTATETEIDWKLEEEISTEQEMVMVEEKNISATEEALIYVYICGAVAEPGVYQVPKGSRLFEAVDAAGGMLEEAEYASQNLARVLQDGEQIRILTKEEAKCLNETDISTHAGNTTESKGLVNINTASVQELTTLTGIGESRAQAIVEYREANGFFKSIDGIKNVTGIKDGLFEKIKDKITV